MNTITAVLKPSEDGTLHLPVPAEWQDQSIKVKAELEPITPPTPRAKAGLWKDLPGRYWMADDFDSPLEDFREYME